MDAQESDPPSLHSAGHTEPESSINKASPAGRESICGVHQMHEIAGALVYGLLLATRLSAVILKQLTVRVGESQKLVALPNRAPQARTR
jgi:hypothetical protein